MEDLHLHNHGQKAIKMIPNKEEITEVSELFTLLSDPTRLQIFWILAHSEECVYNIAMLITMSAPVVSFHLRYLKQAGLIKNRREGKEMHYSLNDSKTALHLAKIVDQFFDKHQ